MASKLCWGNFLNIYLIIIIILLYVIVILPIGIYVIYKDRKYHNNPHWLLFILMIILLITSCISMGEILTNNFKELNENYEVIIEEDNQI